MRKLLIVLLILYGTAGIAQEAKTSMGLRMGSVSGFTLKFIDDDFKALEIIVGGQHDGFRFVGIVQKYTPVAVHRIANFFFVSGIGAHTGYSQFHKNEVKFVNGIEYYSNQQYTSPIFGGDMMLGFEYHFESLPIDISLDYKPYFELFGQKTFKTDFWDIGFSLRYAFNR